MYLHSTYTVALRKLNRIQCIESSCQMLLFYVGSHEKFLIHVKSLTKEHINCTLNNKENHMKLSALSRIYRRNARLLSNGLFFYLHFCVATEDEDMDSDKESNPSQTDYDEEFKQEVVNVATRTSYTVAAREYGLSENQVKDWGRNSIKRKPAQQRAKHQVEQTAQKRFECVVKEWVISQTAKGAELCSTQVREHALKLLKNDDFGFQKPFLASKSWCMRFIRRNRLLELRKSKPIQMIPVDDAGKLSMLRSIIMKKCEHWEYNLSQIGFMEEMTIGLDTEGATVESAISRSDETVFSVVLSCLADGTKLKPVIVVRGTRQRKVIEDLDGIHLHSQAEGLVDESAVLFFVEKVG